MARKNNTAVDVISTDNDDAILAALAAIDDSDALEPVADIDLNSAMPEDIDAALAAADADTPAPVAPVKAVKAARVKKDKTATVAAPSTPARDFYTVANIDAATLTANMAACEAIKVKEKANNLIAAIEHGKKLSRYTGIAVAALVADGKVSGKSLVEKFESVGLSAGTARAQAQQMTALFRMTGLVQADLTVPRDLYITDKRLADELVTLAA